MRSGLEQGARQSGILLHFTSLPSPYGIGDLGPAAFQWVDRLRDAGQAWWQVLPLGATGYGNSPYQPLSSFAGNWLLVSPDALIDDGLVSAQDCQGHSFPPDVVDFDAVTTFKRGLIGTAWTNYRRGARADLRDAYEKFLTDQARWLNDYAFFRALKTRYNGVYFVEWPSDLVHREPSALARARQELKNEIDQITFAQFLFFRQAGLLRQYAKSRGLRIIGDLPFFVSPDSSDVWANPEFFDLDANRRARFVAGVPPDYFAAQGQLWGNPVYNWEALKSTGYRWCLDRQRALLQLVDVIRLDHFRGFVAAWQVSAGAPTAENGTWVAGPGADFFEAVRHEFDGMPFIAEDLGLITPEVMALRDRFGLPGMRVMQFGFDGNAENPHLPHTWTNHTVGYTGTHDNNTTRGWFEALPDGTKQLVRRYVGWSSEDSNGVAAALMRSAWQSAAGLTIAPLQDVLNLGAEARMNVPGRAEGNWRWRWPDSAPHQSEQAFRWLAELTNASGRALEIAQREPESILRAVQQGEIYESNTAIA
jgi:4-alpha-glucanotransferase